IVGTDRTAANGDVANKIGTYTLAVLANRHSIPFYVAAPISSIDFACPDGTHIPIEERAPREVTHVFDRQIAPSGVRVANPAFDVTPAELVTAIVTERGVARQPLARALARLVSAPERRRPGQVEIQLVAGDGSILFRLPGALTVQPHGLGDAIRMDHVLTLNHVQFERPGRYRFDVLVDGRVAAAVPLQVEEIAAAAH